MGVQVSIQLSIPIIPCALTVTSNKRFEPESRHSNGLKEEGRKKTVTFAGSPMVASPSADSLGSALRCRREGFCELGY